MDPYIFVSYHRESDGWYVERLAKFLGERGITAWFDRELVAGERWRNVLSERIDARSAMIVVMTPEADASVWVSREYAWAEKREVPVLPILLRGTPFFGLVNLHYEDATADSMPSDKFVERLRHLIALPVGTGPRGGRGPDPEQRSMGALLNTDDRGDTRQADFSPIFYLSYVRRAYGSDPAPQEVHEFFGELSRDLEELIALPQEQQIGFIDLERHERPLGPAALRNLGTAHLLVALISQSYVLDEQTSMEWSGFASRPPSNKQGRLGSSGILPVLWAPFADIPHPFSEIQRFVPTNLPPSYVQEYEETGLLAIMRSGSRDGLSAITWKLALAIQASFWARRPRDRFVADA